GVGPSVAQGQDTKLLRGILDKTAERIRKELTRQPAVGMELLNTLGQVYLEIGAPEQAAAAHQQALELSKAHFGPGSEEVALDLGNLGQALRDLGKFADAEATNRAALEMCRKLFGNNHTNVAAMLNDLGLTLDDQGKWPE